MSEPATARAPGAGSAKPRPDLSLVLPAYNEEAAIVPAVREALAALSGLTGRHEVLVVDDGSRDATAARVEEAFAGTDAVRLLRHGRNRGYGAALRTGFSAARFDLVAFSDADRQFHLEDLGPLLERMEGHRVVCGFRQDRQDLWPRLVYSKIYNVLVRGLLGVPVRDCDCALKVFRRQDLAEVTISTNGFLVNAELLTLLQDRGASIVEVGVRHRLRREGQSTVSPLHAVPVLFDLLKFWWSKRLFPAPAAESEGARPGHN